MRARIRPLPLVALLATSPWLAAGHALAQSTGYPPAVPVRPSAPAAAPGAVSSTTAAQAPAAAPPVGAVGASPAGPPATTPVPPSAGAPGAPTLPPSAQQTDEDTPGARGATRTLTGTTAPGQAYVVLQSDNPRAKLQIRSGRNWDDVCTTPCRLSLNPSGIYRVGGGGMRASSDFSLPARSAPPVLVDVKAGSIARYWVGFGLTLGGLGALAGGAILYNTEASGDTSAQRDDRRSFNHAVGTVEMVGGAIVTLVGAILWGTSMTSVDVR